MNKTRFLKIVFDQPLQAYEIPYFRAAVIEKTKRESTLFHNHLDDKQYIYRYPLIQYKIHNRKPCMICLAEATEDIHYLLKAKDFNFNIRGKQYAMEIEDVHLRYEHIQSWDRYFTYNIHNYMALNQENFQKYQEAESIVDKMRLLEDMLKVHLGIFAKEMEAYLPHDLDAKIIKINSEKYIEYKKVFHLTFSLNFKSNLFLPNYVGLGKGTSVGFGIVKKLGDG